MSCCEKFLKLRRSVSFFKFFRRQIVLFAEFEYLAHIHKLGIHPSSEVSNNFCTLVSLPSWSGAGTGDVYCEPTDGALEVIGLPPLVS